MLPARNRRDWDDIPPSARDKLRFVWLETVGDALAATLASGEEGQDRIVPVPALGS